MSEGMIIRRGGGISTGWAKIKVKYQSGTTLTATNTSGSIDLSSDERLYFVKAPTSGSEQSCVFTITDSSHPSGKSKTITGITEDSYQEISLCFTLYIYNRGTDTGFDFLPTAGNNYDHGSFLTEDADIRISIVNSTDTFHSICAISTEKIKVKEFTKLYFNGWCTRTADTTCQFFLTPTFGVSSIAMIQYGQSKDISGSESLKYISISQSLSDDEYYVGFCLYSSTISISADAYMTQMYLTT